MLQLIVFIIVVYAVYSFARERVRSATTQERLRQALLDLDYSCGRDSEAVRLICHELNSIMHTSDKNMRINTQLIRATLCSNNTH